METKDIEDLAVGDTVFGFQHPHKNCKSLKIRVENEISGGNKKN